MYQMCITSPPGNRLPLHYLECLPPCVVYHFTEKVEHRKSCSTRNVSNLAKSGKVTLHNKFNFKYMLVIHTYCSEYA